MLKALLRARMQALFSTMFVRSGKKRRSALGTFGMGLLVIYILGCLIFSVGMLCWQISPLAAAGYGWLYFAIMAISALSFCIIGGSFAAKTQIFDARDNELLLSMPIPAGALLLSRILPLLVLNLMYGGMFLLPAGVVYFHLNGAAALPIVLFVLGSLLMILLGTAVAALFGWLLSVLTARSRHKNLASLIFSIAFLGAYFYLYSNIGTYLQKLLQNGASIGESLRRALPPVYHFGMAAAEGSVSSLAVLALWCLIPSVAAFLLLQRSLLRIMTEKRGVARVRYQAGAMPARSAFSALYQKEARRFFGSAVYFMNCGLGVIMMLGGAVVLAIKGPAMLAGFTGGSSELLPGILACVLGFCISMTDPTACSISLEGQNYALLRAMPIRTRDLFGAKIALPLSFGLPACVASCLIAGIALDMDAAQLLGLAASGCALLLWIAVFGLILNLHLPKLDWISEAVVVKQSMSMFIAIFGGMGFVAAPAILYGVLLHGVLSMTVYLWCVAAAFTLLSLLGWRYLLAKGEALLSRI